MIGLPFTEEERIMYLQYAQFSCEGSGRFEYAHSGWVAVNDDLTSYLPDDTESRQGRTVMDEEFVAFGTSRIKAAAGGLRQQRRYQRSQGRGRAAGAVVPAPGRAGARGQIPRGAGARGQALTGMKVQKERQGTALTLFFCVLIVAVFM